MSNETIPAHHEGALDFVENIDISERKDVSKLKGGATGLVGVLFLTVTGSAPITAMMLNTPVAVGAGNGIGAPAAFILSAIVLAIFGVAYVAMARKVTTAGGFYSFVSHGLGREAGMATGLLMVVAYSVFEVALLGGFAYFASEKAAGFGIHLSWLWFAIGSGLIIAALGYFDIELSAKILGVALMCEIVCLLIFDLFMFSKGHVSTAAVNPLNGLKSFGGGSWDGKSLAKGAAGIGIFFAFWSWVGWEMAPNYGEESKNPKRNVPRALYISVIGLGVFYTITSWASLSGYSSIEHAASVSLNSPYDFFLFPAQHYAGYFLKDMLGWFVISGSFACALAFHNTAARYMFALGRERVLPGKLGETHGKHQSPHIASLTQSAIAIVVVVIFALFAPIAKGTGAGTSIAYDQIYTLMATMGAVPVLAIQALVSVAIFAYFFRNHKAEQHWWKTIIAPAIAVLGQAYMVYIAVTNLDVLGGSYTYIKWLLVFDLLVFIGGLFYALRLRFSDPTKFQTVGRVVNEGLDQI